LHLTFGNGGTEPKFKGREEKASSGERAMQCLQLSQREDRKIVTSNQTRKRSLVFSRQMGTYGRVAYGEKKPHRTHFIRLKKKKKPQPARRGPKTALRTKGGLHCGTGGEKAGRGMLMRGRRLRPPPLFGGGPLLGENLPIESERGGGRVLTRPAPLQKERKRRKPRQKFQFLWYWGKKTTRIGKRRKGKILERFSMERGAGPGLDLDGGPGNSKKRENRFNRNRGKEKAQPNAARRREVPAHHTGEKRHLLQAHGRTRYRGNTGKERPFSFSRGVERGRRR